jgi:hypothetical protein
MKRIYTSNDPTILRIHPGLASQIGLNESIMLLQLEFLISISTAEKRDGRDWTFQSVRDLQEKYFPFWSHMTVNRVIKSLENSGYITVKNFNKHKYDKTRWIAINYENLQSLDAIIVKDTPVTKRDDLYQNVTGVYQNVTRSEQNVTTIPEISTEINTENNKKGDTDLFEECKEIFEIKKGRLITDGQAFSQMINNFKANGVTAEDYAAAIDAMDADPKYNGSKPTSYEKWAIGYAQRRKNPVKPKSNGKQRITDDVFEDAKRILREMEDDE